MSTKTEQQMHFVDQMASRENRSNRTARFLERLCRVVDFAPIEAALREAYTATRGRDPHDPLVMFKMTLLQHFYDLSDPECEAQVADRRSFREFCGLGLADRVPDETALVWWMRPSWKRSKPLTFHIKKSGRARGASRPRPSAVKAPRAIRRRAVRPRADGRIMDSRRTWPRTRSTRSSAARS